MPDSFVMHRAIYEALQNLGVRSRAAVYDALFEYAFNGVDSRLTGDAAIVYYAARNLIGFLEVDNG